MRKRKSDYKVNLSIHNEKMNGTLVDVMEYCAVDVVSNKEELDILMLDNLKLSTLSTFQLTTLRSRLGVLGCSVSEIETYAQIINNCIEVIEKKTKERKIPIHKVSQKAFRKSNLFKVKTPSEKKAVKLKKPSVHIVFHHNGGK